MIIHNVPESSLTEANARKKEDIQNLTTLFNQYIASVTNAIRIVKHGNKPRLISRYRYRLQKVLHNRFNFRNKDHPSQITKAAITPDLILKLYKFHYKLHQQLA